MQDKASTGPVTTAVGKRCPEWSRTGWGQRGTVAWTAAESVDQGEGAEASRGGRPGAGGAPEGRSCTAGRYWRGLGLLETAPRVHRARKTERVETLAWTWLPFLATHAPREGKKAHVLSCTCSHTGVRMPTRRGSPSLVLLSGDRPSRQIPTRCLQCPHFTPWTPRGRA